MEQKTNGTGLFFLSPLLLPTGLPHRKEEKKGGLGSHALFFFLPWGIPEGEIWMNRAVF